MTPYTVGDLFAGIGGFSLGFERAGWRVAWQVEIDKFCRGVLARHWPDVARYADVQDFPPAENREAFRVDCITAGWPCQDISTAGSGGGLAGARSGLFFEVVRVVGELRPRVVVLENVPALRFRGLDRVAAELAALGYRVQRESVRAADFGAPHIRERIFIVAVSAPDGSRQPQGHIEKSGRRVGDVDEAVADTRGQGLPAPKQKNISKTGRWKKGEQLPDAVGGPLNPQWVEWLMGFPDGWTDCAH
tara:strand:+ start:2250 stop:2990 length:741 start_codon:yes stop_codon:yes gene_type:complete